MRAKASILASAKAIGAAALVAGCATQPELNASICDGVLRAAATQTPGTSSTMSYFMIDELNGEPVFLAVACDSGDDVRMEEFCGAVVGNTSVEFMDAFAYAVTDCVRANGRVRQLIRGDAGMSGLRRDRGRPLESMDGEIDDTLMLLRQRGSGFELTFQRQANQ